jgi:hypothetical protein
VLVAASADAAPVLLDATGTATAGESCAALTTAASPCALFAIDPFASTTLTGGFEHDNDIALFQFIVEAPTLFAGQTTSYVDGIVGGFDPFFALFYGEGSGDLTGRIVTIVDPTDPTGTALIRARSNDVIGTDPNVFDLNDTLPDPLLQPSVLLGPGTYVLALGQAGNDFLTADFEIGGTLFLLESLTQGFQADGLEDPDFNGGCGLPERCAFALSITATPVDAAPVPEPGALTLVGLGVATAAMRYRRRSKPRP